MIARLSRLLTRRRSATKCHDTVSPAPDTPFVAVGDIHGRADLLQELHDRIAARFDGWPIVFLGDYVDRGEGSREVLEFLREISETPDAAVTCLMGNHERMLLDFLDDPLENAAMWLENGGLPTLASFGVRLPRSRVTIQAAASDLRAQLAKAMGKELIAWIRARPLSWQSGNVWAVHAGVDPSLPLQDQMAETLLWGHPAFRRQQTATGALVVHGHTIVTRPDHLYTRIAIDTGAYATGRLTAAAIMPDAIQFLQTGRA